MRDQADRLRELAKGTKQSEKTTKVITVTSGKGGVGKSNFVVNLAIMLQKMGKKVLIFDADIGMANDEILMGFVPKYNILDCINRNLDIEDIIITGPEGVKLISGGTGLNKIKELQDEERRILLSKLEKLEDYDYIIMDTGAGVNETVINFIAFSDEFILLTTPEPTSIMDGYSLLKTVSYFDVKKMVSIVVNRVYNEKEGEKTFLKLKNASTKFLSIKCNFVGCIEEDKKLSEAVRNQVPLVMSFPSSKAAKNISAIARIIENNSIVNKENKGVNHLFKNILQLFR